jgi:hypothetical protein
MFKDVRGVESQGAHGFQRNFAKVSRRKGNQETVSGLLGNPFQARMENSLLNWTPGHSRGWLGQPGDD